MAHYIVIPAQLQSKRLPNKLLLNETGKPLIQHTWENCLKVPNAQVIIATGDEEISDVCKGFGAEVHFDTTQVSCGTDRVVKTVLLRDDCKAVVNVQGEWPTIDPQAIVAILKNVDSHYAPTTASLYYRGIPNNDPNIVKVVLGNLDRALYFSRASIPHNATEFLYHVGAYALNRRMIAFYDHWIGKPWNSPLKSESLEQLRILDNNFPIYMKETSPTYGIDTREAYDRFICEQRSIAEAQAKSECSA